MFDAEEQRLRRWRTFTSHARAVHAHRGSRRHRPPIGIECEDEVWPAGHLKLPRKELSRLLQMQRGVEVPFMANGCGLGGTCEFYRIGADGVYFDELIRFPEAVGDVLDGSRPGEHIPSRMDLAFAV